MTVDPQEEDNPFESPAAMGPATSRGKRGRVFAFRSGHVRAMIVIGLLDLVVLVGVVSIAFGWLQVQLLNRMAGGAGVNPSEISANDGRTLACAVAAFIAIAMTSIAFLFWIHRAYRNLPALGAKRLEFSPGTAVGWWFVPIASLVVPYQVVQEIWTRSDPTKLTGVGAASPLVRWWWAFWVMLVVISNYFLFTAHQVKSLAELIEGTYANMAVNLLKVLAAVMAILVVRGIDRRQDERYAKLATSPGPAAALPSDSPSDSPFE